MPRSTGNLWNQSSCNRLIAERMESNKHDKHLRALQRAKKMVDNQAPKEHKHLQDKLKTKKLQEDRATEIQLENRVLLQKMLNIDVKQTDLNGEALVNQRVQPRSLNSGVQRKEFLRITERNQQMLRRLQGARGNYNARTWEDEEVDRQALKFRLSQNASRGRVASNLKPPERPHPSQRLPPIPGLHSSGSDDWTALSDDELNRRLRRLNEQEKQICALEGAEAGNRGALAPCSDTALRGNSQG